MADSRGESVVAVGAPERPEHPQKAAGPVPATLRTWAGRYRDAVEPRADGLPRARVLLAFPAFVLLVMIVLVTFGISGTSSGVMRGYFETGPDPARLLFAPQPIRSDEWAVQTVYIVSQVEEGLPVTNETMPGGVDMTMNFETPYAEWSAAFRPHNLGFFVLPLEQAFALRWWLPGAALVAAASMFLVSLWPRRPGAAALVATAFGASPFFMWWYLPHTLWPPAWALLVMTAVIWCQALQRRRTRWAWGAVVGYVSVTAALGMYVPFLIPALYVTAAFSIGWVLRRGVPLGWGERLRRVAPVLVGGAVAGLVIVVFLLTRWETVERFLSTVYPGQRLVPMGATLTDDEWESSFLGVFSLSLRGGSSFGVQGNSSEASTFVLIGAFVAIAGLWLAARSLRPGPADVPLLAALACGALFAAHLFVPGWDALAHLLLLDRVQQSRMVLGIGLLALVLIGLVVRAMTEQRVRVPWWAAVGIAALTVLVHAALIQRLSDKPGFVEAAGPWPVLVAIFALAVLAFLRGRTLVGGAAYLVLALALGAWVNPLYQGVYDLRETDVGQEVLAQEAADPGTWVGVGDALVGPVLTMTGVGAINGMQAAPDVQTWRELDPDGAYEGVWNRMANVAWTAEPGEDRMFNPAGDQIRVRFDACARFEQETVDHVLAAERLDQPCLRQTGEVPAVGATYYLYTVEPAPSGG